MTPRKTNRTIKNYFDEETGDDESANDSFVSPETESNSGTDFNATRQPLASSSRQSIRKSTKKSAQIPKSKGIPVDSAARQRISPRKSTLRPQPNSSNKTKEKSKAKKNISFPEPDTGYAPRRKSNANQEEIIKNQQSTSRRKNKNPKKHVLQEIRKYQNTANVLIPKLPFSKLIREVLTDPSISTNNDLRVTPMALEAIQEAAEVYLTIFFEDAYRCTIHRGRVTLIVKDMELVRVLRGVSDPGFRE